MQHGPVDFIMVKFGDAHPSASVAEGLKSLIDAGTIRIVDIIFVDHGDSGEVQVLELGDLSDEAYDAWNAIVDEMGTLLSADDATTLASGLGENESAALVIYENVWARQMTATIADAQGEVLLHTRIPRDVVAELIGTVE